MRELYLVNGVVFDSLEDVDSTFGLNEYQSASVQECVNTIMETRPLLSYFHHLALDLFDQKKEVRSTLLNQCGRVSKDSEGYRSLKRAADELQSQMAGIYEMIDLIAQKAVLYDNILERAALHRKED